ncbi:hypothetical protein TBR22_A50490 [Luteitalea sp. TBR-22]|uniref:helicase-related protein n=1 Tax=Luteitalea sp. TBR-22 TaxID=2802971 RepID=UPI001AF950BD|nr:DEAD/DEAH box helicase [Luteitalea sp. TBR-22]BCS35815.1 hypothetical protein TBR22_A50490 [Luteitalea sp. TBR-22]
MLHTRVWCRAREWDVVDRRQEGDVTFWRLRHDQDPPRLLASPPDVVRPLQDSAARVSMRAWVRALLACLRAWMPPWWPSALLRLSIDHLAWQAVPAMLVLSGGHRRLLLADPVGMGKTVQAALLLREVHDRDPNACSLIVAPAALVGQWLTELRQRAGLEATVLDAVRLRAEAILPQRLVDEARRGTCWIASIDLLRQPDVSPLFASTAWTILVVDEAHAAAPATARLDAIRRVASSSARILLLTATPAASGPAGLEALRAIGARAGEPPMTVVRREAARSGPARRTCVCHVRLERPHAVLCARLDAFAARARVERGTAGLLPALVLRRRAASCPGALARSLERRLMVLGTDATPVARPLLFDDQDELDDEAMRVPAWRDHGTEREELRGLLAQARALRPSGRKLDVVCRLLRRACEPVVVFTAYVDTARVLRDLLHGSRLVLVHGRLPDAIRAQAIEAFTSGDADVLITTDASAEGLNLHARCRWVVHADLPVSPRLLAQRTGRVDRMGQQRRVHEVLLSSHTSEDVEVLARLRAGAIRDSDWMDHRVCVESRRTRLAAACLDRARRAEATAGDGRVRPMACVVPPARWHRLRSRWALPPDTLAVQVSRVTVSGATPLATTHVPVAWSTRRAGTASTITRQSGGVWRAQARSRRLDAWQRDAEANALEVRARATRQDLFGQEGPGSNVPCPEGQAAITARVLGWIAVRRHQGRPG